MTYVPSDDILKKYADLLIKFALNKCQGISKGDVVLLQVPECAKPILKPLRNSVLEAGGNPIVQYFPDDIARDYFELASDDQLKFFPEEYLRGKLNQVDHSVAIIAETNKKELEGIDPQKIMMRQSSFKPYMEWREKKETEGNYSWTLALFGTPQMAKEVNMSEEDYWNEIITACYLDEEDPVAKWKEIHKEIFRVKQKLTSLKIDSVHVKAKGTDIHIGIGEKRIWNGGSGRNIPSFEVFTSPDWRRINGHMQFTEPLYRYGSLIENIYLEFKDGEVITATASKGEDVLKEMIATPNANKAGEFSLTDGRLSKITKFMAETLFDENVGGPEGNTHIALGMSYKDCYEGNPAEVSKEEWDRLGYNESVIHTDIVSTSNRKVIATLESGEELLIYENGKFAI